MQTRLKERSQEIESFGIRLSTRRLPSLSEAELNERLIICEEMTSIASRIETQLTITVPYQDIEKTGGNIAVTDGKCRTCRPAP